MADRPPENIWKRLTRLFRSGPVVRHKIAAGERMVEPKGTASAFKRELSSLYVRALSSYANYERLSRYSDYNEMEQTPELHSAMDIYSDEVTVRSEEGHVLEVRSKNQEIKEILEELFFDILDIDFNAWNWVRHLCKYGDLVLFVDATDQAGILNLFPIPINEVEREEGYDPNDPLAVRFRWLTRGNAILQNWQVVHFRLLGNDSYLPYGCSVLEAARRIWRQLILIEDAMLVYRIVRSPERRVFHIEIGNTPPEHVDSFIEVVRSNLKRSTLINQNSGQVDLRYNPLSVEDDYFLPKRGETMSRIDTLAGGQFTGDIDDVRYIQSKLFAAIKIPRAYLGYDEGVGSKSTLCLRGDTLVATLNGDRTISELESRFREGKRDWVLSSDGNGVPEPAPILKVWPTKEVHELIRVTLDDGSAIEATDTHPFMLRDGSYRNALDLRPGDSLMPGYRRLSSKEQGDKLDGYQMLYDNSSGTWRYVHRIVDDAGLISRDVTKSRVIHHVDCDKLNNDPTNLMEMTWFGHRRWHQRNAALTLQTPAAREKAAPKLDAHRRSSAMREMWRRLGKESSAPGTPFYEYIHGPLASTEGSRRMQEFWSRPEYRALKISQIKEMWADPEFKDAHSGTNHWISKKNSEFDAGWLAKFCKEHAILQKKQLFSHPDFPIGGRWYQKILKSVDCRDFRQFYKRFVANNHSVASVEVIRLTTVEPVYDIEVGATSARGSNHNFLLGCGVFVHNSQEDVRFAKTIERIQRLFVAELNKIAIIHLAIMGFSGQDLANFTLEMASPSTIAQQQRLELWRMRFEVAGMAQEGVLDRGTIYRRIFNLNDRQIAMIKDGKRVDKLEDQLLGSIEAPPGGEEPPTGGGGEPAPGQEELPATLGGPEGGGQGTPQPLQQNFVAGPPGLLVTDGAEPARPAGQAGQMIGRTVSYMGRPFRITAAHVGSPYDPNDASVFYGGFFPDDGNPSIRVIPADATEQLETTEPPVDERFNPGSSGDRAEVAVDKGKDLFSTHDSALALTFGTEKQTASDPYDNRAQRRLVTRPFSEDAGPTDPSDHGIAEAEELGESLDWLASWLRRRSR